MKIKRIFIILHFISLISFSQSPDEMFAKHMGFNEKVLINNNLNSYIVGISSTTNGVEKEFEYFRNELNDPYNIEIVSSKSSGKIVIKNKLFKNPFEINFNTIYKKNEYKDITYFFATNNPNVSVYYSKKNGQNDTLLITIKKDSSNNIIYLYTISNL